MHAHTLDRLKHEHDFSVINRKGERRTKLVLILTFLTMLLEIAAGILFGSMALLADGWHMGTHVAAFMITLVAYRYSRVHAHDQTFAFSSGKVGVLGGYTSSVVLGVVALIMLIESGQRIVHPQLIHFNEAIAVAGFGLLINLISALLLKDHHGHDHNDHHDHHDHNLKAAYLHVLADALTSVLAIIALVLGKYYGWNWLDPVMGIVGALIIMQWSYSLMRETSPVLLDESIALKYKLAIKERIESDADNRISDLHIWRVGPGHFAIIVSIVSHDPKAPEYYKELLKGFRYGGISKLSHITVEVNRCAGDFCIK
ncbi:CDF family Co(II)/Ni(II) efflux transporter DmeF [Methylobacter svalbardensis]|uniref:CDF family Co(II)/Ni(II) efflux transporter DmeF n=1 Tax=Methylobacter svalbardensis TaxID=3080016 RepID=UPI0030EF9E0F